MKRSLADAQAAEATSAMARDIAAIKAQLGITDEGEPEDGRPAARAKKAPASPLEKKVDKLTRMVESLAKAQGAKAPATPVEAGDDEPEQDEPGE